MLTFEQTTKLTFCFCCLLNHHLFVGGQTGPGGQADKREDYKTWFRLAQNIYTEIEATADG